MQELPTEILVIAFKAAVRQATRSADRYISLFCLMLVCRQWCDIIIGNTTFWSHVTASDEESIRFALKSIGRSGNSQLSARLTWNSSVTAKQMVALLSKLAGRSHQLTKFSIVAPSPLTIPRWTSPANNLHTLVLRNKGAQQPLIDFFGGPLPQLRYLALEGFCSWPAGLFCGLYYITLQLPSTSGTTSFADFLNLLAASPGLRSLNISGCTGTPRFRHPPKAIALPHLTSLTIYKSSSHDVLSHVSLPSDVEVRLIECTNIMNDRGVNSPLGPGDSTPSFLAGLFTLRVVFDVKHSTLNLTAFKHRRSTPALVIKEKFTSQFRNGVIKSLEGYATTPAFASVEALFVVADTPFQMPWNRWLASFRTLRQVVVRTRHAATLRAILHSELGCDPVLYPCRKFSSTQKAPGMEYIHIDWRATSHHIHYHCTFEDVSCTEPRGMGGLVSQMKPRGVVTSRRGRDWD